MEKERLSRFDHLKRRIKIFKNWYLICFPLTGLIKSKERILKLRSGGKIYLRNIFAADFYVTMEIIDSERDDYQLSKLRLPVDAVIIDAGANIGAFTIAIAMGYPARTIISFEPEESNFHTLVKNIDLNSFKNVTAYQKAIAGKGGEVELFIHPYDTASHSLVEFSQRPNTNDVTNARVQIVEAVTLETIVVDHNLKKIDLLKLDVEGAEYEILFNCPSYILALINCISIEIHDHPKYQSKDLISYLERNGFNCQQSSTRENVYILIR